MLRMLILERGQSRWLDRPSASGKTSSLFLSIYNIIVILHRDERREFVVDSIICPLMSDLESYAVGGCAYFAWQETDEKYYSE